MNMVQNTQRTNRCAD